ncbi:hypothetical protein TEA_000434 [Camellia sinensis var. sinensis]|uniref:D-isomer specific 2-hydroxyacid dehydrogenase NAD-binding domain-containing protein n=1 Tax=Camellia sinensis var. sinensis TaxID=542762 RepID=A0A4S4D9R4_CAMSN|nr:hypothetical protein TEA_000434 [Camellia sinensis var. sinensis]
MITNEHGISSYPMVPGHEMVGVVTQVGCKVNKFKHFAVRFPDSLSPEGVAPLLCGGITVYSPMKYFGLSEAGKHLGVVGLGGLGHLAVKFAKAFGMKVTVISTSPNKKEESSDRFGADSFLISTDAMQMQVAAMGTMDGILDTVSGLHPLSPLIGLLKWRKLIAGSISGGLKETQEIIDFAAKHNIVADVEVIPMDYVNTAMKRLAKGDIRYRFVIDIGNTLTARLVLNLVGL